MSVGGRVGSFAILTALAAGLAIAPAVARWDVYRCAGMGTTHLGRCCATAHAEPSRTHELRSEPRQCCVLEAEGTEAPSSATSTPTSLVGAPTATGLVIAAVLPPAHTRARPLLTRSRAPPSGRLYVQHSSFLL